MKGTKTVVRRALRYGVLPLSLLAAGGVVWQSSYAQTSKIYVDGALSVSGTTSATANYTGFWRVGSGSLGTGGTYPTSVAFEGSIDHVAVYTAVLTASEIAAHYAAR